MKPKRRKMKKQKSKKKKKLKRRKMGWVKSVKREVNKSQSLFGYNGIQTILLRVSHIASKW